MHHPLENIRSSVRDRMIFPFVGLSLLLLFILNQVGQQLVTPAAPYGIVSFELAREVSRVESILDSWGQASQLRAAFSLGLDFLFIPVYMMGISLTCLWAAHFHRERRRFPSWLVIIGVPGTLIAWLQLPAAGLDIIENMAMAHMLFSTVVSPWPFVASTCAMVKFSLVVAGIIYSLVAFVAYIGTVALHRQRTGI